MSDELKESNRKSGEICHFDVIEGKVRFGYVYDSLCVFARIRKLGV